MNKDTNPFEAYDEKVAAADQQVQGEGSAAVGPDAYYAIKAEGVDGATLLDIGGGIGVIQHELLSRSRACDEHRGIVSLPGGGAQRERSARPG